MAKVSHRIGVRLRTLEQDPIGRSFGESACERTLGWYSHQHTSGTWLVSGYFVPIAARTRASTGAAVRCKSKKMLSVTQANARKTFATTDDKPGWHGELRVSSCDCCPLRDLASSVAATR